MPVLEVMVVMLMGVIGVAVLTGTLVARARMRAVRAVSQSTPCVPTGIPSAASVARTHDAKKRRSRLFVHDYDRWIGRTLFR